MTIDTNELRRLVQAATKGPWVSQGRYIGTPRHMSYIGEVRDQCGNWSDTEKSRADAAFIAAANPAAVSEMIERLEAAEKSDAESIAMYRKARDERDELRAKIETAENDAAHQKALAASALRVAEGWERKCGELRAKVEEMEKQEPVAWIYEDMLGRKCVGFNKPLHRPNTHEPLYTLPGAQPASSIPEGWKKELFCIQHAMAMNSWDWESDASNDMKRAAYAAVVRLRAAAPEAKP